MKVFLYVLAVLGFIHALSLSYGSTTAFHQITTAVTYLSCFVLLSSAAIIGAIEKAAKREQK